MDPIWIGYGSDLHRIWIKYGLDMDRIWIRYVYKSGPKTIFFLNNTVLGTLFRTSSDICLVAKSQDNFQLFCLPFPNFPGPGPASGGGGGGHQWSPSRPI